MVELFCAIVGEERVTNNNIGPREAVGEVKDQMMKKIQYEFPSDKLALYLIKKSATKKKWIKDDDGNLVRL